MRILQINSVYKFGSTGRIVHNIHKYLLEKGHESYVIYGRGKKYKDKNVFKIGSIASQFIDFLFTRTMNKHGEFNIFFTKLIIKKIIEINPDIIHLHNIHGYYVYYKMLFTFLKNSKIQVVWLFHDKWALSGSSAIYDEKKINWEHPDKKLLKLISHNYPKYIYINSHSALGNYKKKKYIFDIPNLTIVVPSKWLLNIVKNSFLSNKNIFLIYNGLDLSQFYPRSYTFSKKFKIIAVSNYWNESKGLFFINKLADILDNMYSIKLIGDADKNKINPNIKYYGRVENVDELTKLYSEADILINPTLEDNFPSVNIEAQACGTPVITFNTGGAGESIIKGTGKVIKKGNFNELIRAISRCPKKNKNIISKCRNNALNYSVKHMVETYLELYNSLT